jgi:hypothetical protein
MKINLIISTVTAISKWLHGEGSAHFRAYTYPRIKEFTRRFINLGLYEQFDRFYRIVDDTYYKGTIENSFDDNFAIAKLEHNLDSIVAVDESNTLPKFANIKSRLNIWKSLEQGNTYRCATFTMNNMLRTVMLNLGLKPDLEVTSIDPLYIETKYGKGKQGTIIEVALNHLNKFGYPMPSWTPSMTNHDKELDALEASVPAKRAKLFGGIKPTGKVRATSNLQEAINLDATLPDNWVMQVSIAFCASLKYFGKKAPYLEKINGQYSLIRTGGHSIHGVRKSFSTWEDGQPGFAIIDSAYLSYEEGWRFFTKQLFDAGLITVRFVEFPTESVSFVPTQVLNDQNILSTTPISQGESGEKVNALQRFLGITTTGNFDNPTVVALKKWQDAQFGPKYTGQFWGQISIARYKQIKKI